MSRVIGLRWTGPGASDPVVVAGIGAFAGGVLDLRRWKGQLSVKRAHGTITVSGPGSQGYEQDIAHMVDDPAVDDATAIENAIRQWARHNACIQLIEE